MTARAPEPLARAGLRLLALLVRFVLELSALVALAWGGWRLPGVDALVRALAAVAAPLLAALAWGSYVAPRAPWRLPGWRRLVPELAVFGAAAAALAVAGHPRLAVAFALVAAADSAVVHRLGE